MGKRKVWETTIQSPVSEERGERGAQGTRPEISLQPVEKTTLKQVVPLQPMERKTVKHIVPAAC